jgi:hypothetical protein
MYPLKSYIDFLNEKMSMPTKKWVDIDLMKIDDEVGENIWKMYIDTYLPQGMDLSAEDWKEMQRKYKASWLIDIDKDKDPDAFIIYQQTKWGNKISLLGTAGNRDAKKALINKLFDLLKGRGWYIEASMKMEDILRKSSINVVKDNKVIMDMISGASVLGDGYYERPLSKVNKVIVKRIYGNPK